MNTRRPRSAPGPAAGRRESRSGGVSPCRGWSERPDDWQPSAPSRRGVGPPFGLRYAIVDSGHRPKPQQGIRRGEEQDGRQDDDADESQRLARDDPRPRRRGGLACGASRKRLRAYTRTRLASGPRPSRRQAYGRPFIASRVVGRASRALAAMARAGWALQPSCSEAARRCCAARSTRRSRRSGSAEGEMPRTHCGVSCRQRRCVPASELTATGQACRHEHGGPALCDRTTGVCCVTNLAEVHLPDKDGRSLCGTPGGRSSAFALPTCRLCLDWVSPSLVTTEDAAAHVIGGVPRSSWPGVSRSPRAMAPLRRLRGG